MSLTDFTVLSKIGEGSYSSVHKVKRISDGQQYALKKVRLLALKQKERQNALNQVRILASIDSPYIISYKDAFIDQPSNCLCVIMQYADGGDLQQKIEQLSKRHLHLEEPQIWRVINHTLNGLKVLHDLQIMHRDLKCANIFISKGNYKLGDMNVSKILKRGLAYTQTGTPYYASPEVWRDEPYDSKSDIWSLGCAIYELCALKPPFQARNMEGLFKKIQKGQFQRIPQRYSDDLQRFITLCLQMQANKRPNCAQLLKQPLVSDQPNPQKLTDNLNLLDTIKLPRNLMYLKSMLPKSKYSSGATTTNSQKQIRIPSRKSQGVGNRQRDYSLRQQSLKKNVSQKNMLPQLKPITRPLQKQQLKLQPITPSASLAKKAYDQYFGKDPDLNKNIALLNLLKQQQRQRNALLEKFRQAQKKEYEGNYNSHNRDNYHSVENKELLRIAQKERNLLGPYALPAKEKPDSKLPQIAVAAENVYNRRQEKPVTYEYVRPSWWG